MIDLHAHLDLYPDPAATTKECVERKLFVLSVTTTPSAWPGTAALAKDAARIRTAIGLHPQIAQERQGELALFEELLPRSRYVGENVPSRNSMAGRPCRWNGRGQSERREGRASGTRIDAA